jgi:hypothetical protein
VAGIGVGIVAILKEALVVFARVFGQLRVNLATRAER